MVQGKILSYGANIEEAVRIKNNVFISELGYPSEYVNDGRDNMAEHVIVKADDIYVATGRITYDGERFELSHIAVLKDYRNRKYGDFVVRMLVSKAFMAGAKEVYTRPNITSMNLFTKIGFKVDEINDGTVKITSGDFDTCCNCCK